MYFHSESRGGKASEEDWCTPQLWRLNSGLLHADDWNLLFGIISDKVGWSRTIALCGGVGSAITTLPLYYVPQIFGANCTLCVIACAMHGATLAGYVLLSALMPSLAPRSPRRRHVNAQPRRRRQYVGRACHRPCLPHPLGVGGVMWIFAVLYLISAVLAMMLKLPNESQVMAVSAKSLREQTRVYSGMPVSSGKPWRQSVRLKVGSLTILGTGLSPQTF